ncbi:hypothetical protein NMY22_g18205 [Coprinellus aureogranulatus]|nr:hypothetical protein NMY22_g18205 [Coprinellus aureogranulatus]
MDWSAYGRMEGSRRSEEDGEERIESIQSASTSTEEEGGRKKDAPKMMTATSTLQSTPSSYAFLNNPFLRYTSFTAHIVGAVVVVVVSKIMAREGKIGKTLFIITRYGVLVYIALNLTKGYRIYLSINADTSVFEVGFEVGLIVGFVIKTTENRLRRRFDTRKPTLSRPSNGLPFSPLRISPKFEGCRALLIMTILIARITSLASEAATGICVAVLVGLGRYSFSAVMLFCSLCPVAFAIMQIVIIMDMPKEPTRPLDARLGYSCSLPSSREFEARLPGHSLAVFSNLEYARASVLVLLALLTLAIRRRHRGGLIRVMTLDGGLYYIAMAAIQLFFIITFHSAFFSVEAALASPMTSLGNSLRTIVAPILSQRMLMNIEPGGSLERQSVSTELLFSSRPSWVDSGDRSTRPYPAPVTSVGDPVPVRINGGIRVELIAHDHDHAVSSTVQPSLHLLMEESPYRGLKRRLVLAFDVGTTFSGVSYCILDPGSIPEIKGVTRFPAHEQVSGASKIPTVLYYDKAGKVQAIGAEALQEGIFEQAEENGWIKAEWFKLHIRPREGESASEIASKIPPLPLNKTVTDVLADYISYLFDCAKSYIRDTHANGSDLWDSVKNDIEFVLSHPNGWEGYQQTQIRQSVVKAGLIKESQGDRVSFISEGEASLWFALKHGLPEGTMERGEGVVIVDAGGGTIDISTYQKPVGGKKFEEISAPKCHFYGSIFVSIHARLFFQELLKESDYLDDLDHIVRCFDKTTKIRFADDTVTQYVKFGSTKDRDEEVGIRFGQLKLSGTDVATFFEPSIKCIIGTVEEMLRMGTHHITHVVLVGGFGASDWLFKQLQKDLGSQGLKVVRPELYVPGRDKPVHHRSNHRSKGSLIFYIHRNKAVSDGAVAFHLSSQVQARIAKYSYGTLQNVEYNAKDAEHQRRASQILVRPSGRKLVPCGFAAMLKKVRPTCHPLPTECVTDDRVKGTRVSDDNEVKINLWREVDTKAQLTSVAFDVHCYKGRLDNPRFFDMDPNNFRKLCSIETDLSHLPLTPETRKNGGGTYYTVKYWVVLKFNSAELKAQMLWMENGVEKRSPATLVFYQDS